MDGEQADHFVLRDGLSPAQGEIVRHAAVLFGQFGYTKTNIGDIAERVGMSPGNLYRYYRNKQGIGEEVVRCYLAHAEAVMEASIAGARGPEARLRAVFHAGIGDLLDALRRNPRMVELADMICTGNSGILRSHLEWKIGTFAALLREGAEAGDWSLADPEAMAETLLDATRAFWMPMALAQLDPPRVPLRVDRVLDALIAGWREPIQTETP
jgi:AcrR family transcriptional regulator